jgi:hypothetical protein
MHNGIRTPHVVPDREANAKKECVLSRAPLGRTKGRQTYKKKKN